MEKNKKKTKRVLNPKKVISVALVIISLNILVISGINLLKWYNDNKKTEEAITEVQNSVTIDEVIDNENTVYVEQGDIDLDNPYWSYITMNLINVDFSDLLDTNDETVGWLQVSGTNINYPFVQTSDNDYYLSHSFDSSWNDAGWIFADYRNDMESFDKNTIIYGHSRLDTTMFGSLKDVRKSGWLDDSDNFVIKLSTETENTLWQVFSVYTIPNTTDYLVTSFSSNSEFLEFANMLLNRSEFDFNTTISENDKILTLSTCYTDDERVVLHAKLIKSEAR